MNKDEKVRYLANIYHLLTSDGAVERIEENVFEEIANEIRAGYFEKKEAKDLAQNKQYQVSLAGRWSDRIRNLEDMLFAAFCNGVFERTEKKLIQVYANQMGINQPQFDIIKEETRRRYAEFKENPIG